VPRDGECRAAEPLQGVLDESGGVLGFCPGVTLLPPPSFAPLGNRSSATAAAKALRELISAKTDVEYGTALITAAKAEPLVRRAATLVALAVDIVRLGR